MSNNKINKSINEYEIMPTKLEKFIIKVDDFKQSMGRWYSIFALRVLPFLIYFIPVAVIVGRGLSFIERFLPNVDLRGTLTNVVCIVAMLGFLAVSILSPKAATVLELVLGFLYLFFAFRSHLFNTVLGYFVLFSMILFLLVKLVFLVFKLISITAFAGDKKKNIERDESGRIVRETKDNVYYIEEDKKAEGDEYANSEDDDVAYSIDDEGAEDYEYANEYNASDEMAFSSDDENAEDYEYANAHNASDEVAYSTDDENAEDYEYANAYNASEEVVFISEEENLENEENLEPIAVTDDVVFAGDDEYPESEHIAADTDDEIFFAQNDEFPEDDESERAKMAIDNDYFFG